MKQLKFDTCLFVGEKFTCIVYVGNIIIWARNEYDIHNLEMHLQELGVDLGQDDDSAGLLGVTLEQESNTGFIEMKQTGLIQRVVEAVGLDVGMVKGGITPSEQRPLVKDDYDKPPGEMLIDVHDTCFIPRDFMIWN